MPILPVLGHKTITSYFSPTSSTKRKRKEVDKAGTSPVNEGISKRPRQSARSSFPSSSKLVDIRPKEDIGHGLKFTKRANSSSHSSSDSLCTPLGNHSWSLDGTLPTPPLTCMSPLPPRKVSENGPTLSTRRSEAHRCQENEEESTHPPPSPPPKNHNGTNIQPSGMSASFLVEPNVTNVMPTMPELIIPSSQSQDSPSMEVDILTSFSRVVSGNLPIPGPTEGEDLIIQSSQSQLLIIASPNVRKLELEPTVPAFNVIIPSSQSQEEELTIPTEKDMETGTRGMYICRTVQSFEIPQRTSLFSVPIQGSISDNFFPLDTPPGNNPDSADSETEDEHEVINSFYKERIHGPASWNLAAKASGDSQPSLGIGSYSSLPPEVWEFRKMFENGEDSYPADFPESLRS